MKLTNKQCFIYYMMSLNKVLSYIPPDSDDETMESISNVIGNIDIYLSGGDDSHFEKRISEFLDMVYDGRTTEEVMELASNFYDKWIKRNKDIESLMYEDLLSVVTIADTLRDSGPQAMEDFKNIVYNNSNKNDYHTKIENFCKKYMWNIE